VGTQDLYSHVKDDQSLVVRLSHFSGATVIGGGLSIIVDGEVIGGIGVGGGTMGEDVACAEAWLTVIGN